MIQYNDQNRPLEPEQFYHIYNRGNQGNSIFFLDENYRYFLSKFRHYLSAYLDVFAYCLLKNHFHFFVRIKDGEAILQKYHDDNAKELRKELLPNEIISEQFRLLFLSYAKAVSKQEQLTGSIFQKVFRRRFVDSDIYFARLIYYLHSNPMHHKITDNFTSYPWSSYQSILPNNDPAVRSKEVLAIFGGPDGFCDFHNRSIDLKEIEHLQIED